MSLNVPLVLSAIFSSCCLQKPKHVSTIPQVAGSLADRGLLHGRAARRPSDHDRLLRRERVSRCDRIACYVVDREARASGVKVKLVFE